MEELSGCVDGFVVDESEASWWSAPEIVQHSVEFSASGYRDEHFGRLGIVRPEALDSSVTRRKADYLAGRYCARHVLRRLGSQGSVGTSNGRVPAWPASIIGSISHSGQRAVAVATREGDVLGVGVDIEDAIAPEVVKELQPQVLNDTERQWLKLADMAPEEAFALIFSAKESFYKALHPTVKAYFGFEAVSVSAIDTLGRTIHFTLNAPLAAGRWAAGSRFTAEYRRLASGAVATLVVVRPTEARILSSSATAT